MSRNCVLENLPEATLGSSSYAICINEGILNGANLSCKKSLNSCSDNSIEGFRQIATHKVSPRRSSGIPNTAASCTDG